METEYKVVDGKAKTWRYFWRQFFVCSTSSTTYFMLGLSLGSPTVTVPQLRREANSTAAVSEEMASWLGSVISYTAMAWLLVLLAATHYFGRKKPMIVILVNALCGYILFFFSQDVHQVFISQIIQGLTQASYTTTCSLIALEYTSPSYRGLFLGFSSATFFWGIWIANTVGMFFNYRYIGLVGIICAVYTIVSLFFIPESPYWLACQGKYDECSAAHRWVKGVDDEAENELNVLIKSQKDIACSVKMNTKKSFLEHVKYYLEAVQDPQIYKPIFLILITVAAYQLSGKLVCAVYAVEIMKKLTNTEFEAYAGVLILDGVSVAGMYYGSFLSNRMRRRTLLLGSSLFCVLFLYLLAIYLYLVEFSVVKENVYIPLIILIGFSLTACGTIIVSHSLYGELYPTKNRTFAMCLICMMSKLVMGTIFKTTPSLFKALQVRGAFLFFAITFSISILLVYLYIPETKGKTMEEISASFAKKRNKSMDKELQILQITKNT